MGDWFWLSAQGSTWTRSLLDALLWHLSHNELLQGGLVLGVLAWLGIALRRVPSMALDAVKRRFILTIEIDDRDEAFEWLKAWLAQHPYTERARRWMILRRSNVDESQPAEGNGESTTAQHTPEVQLTLAPGLHLLRYNERFLWLNFVREPMKLGGMVLGYQERMHIGIVGQEAEIIQSLLRDAYEAAQPKEPRTVDIRTAAWGSWQRIGYRIARPLSSLVFDDSVASDLLAEIRQFWAEQDWYANAGIPWRRGYLLTGPPGNGKSSLVMALSGELQAQLRIINLGAVSSDDTLMGLMLSVPSRVILLMEDIDDARVEEAPQRGEGVTLTGLLNAIDGIAAAEGRVLFLTTNKAAQLAPALVRPGRTDRHVHLANASGAQAKAFFSRFFGDGSDGLADQIGSIVPDGEVSMAALQEQFIACRDDPATAVSAVRDLVVANSRVGEQNGEY